MLLEAFVYQSSLAINYHSATHLVKGFAPEKRQGYCETSFAELAREL
jgi:hypothetical protein